MEMIIIVDTKPIKMNPFVSKILSNVIMAAVNSLDLPKSDWKILETKITR